MKKLVLAMVLLTTLGVMAQRHGDHKMCKGEKMDMTAGQMATLQAKKLTLALDLSEAQQKQVMDITLEAAEHRKATREEVKAHRESGKREKPTPEERFKMQNALLDHQIAINQKMKNVLTQEQYETWKKMQAHKAKHGKEKMKKCRDSK